MKGGPKHLRPGQQKLKGKKTGCMPGCGCCGPVVNKKIDYIQSNNFHNKIQDWDTV